MVWIPAGEFLMGSNDDRADEKPQREVYLDGFWIYKYEVTVAQYRRFCEATGRRMPDAPEWGWRDNHPMVDVGWKDACSYAAWAGMRLPTEAEWEKAARGTHGRKYPWGDQWHKTKCAPGDTFGTQPVGSHPSGASPYGCMDMAGNAWEWCADRYDQHYYTIAPTRNPTGPSAVAAGGCRVVRGGGWGSDFWEGEFGEPGLRCAFRSYCNESEWGYYGYSLGFRIAL
jgi:formylglycine-generating enzyme required for sulfatase activity